MAPSFGLISPNPARRISRYCGKFSSFIRSPWRIRSTSASGRSSTTTTTSCSWSSTAPSPMRTGWSRCTASTPNTSSSPSAETRPRLHRGTRIATRSARRPIDDPALLLYRIIDALVDSFFPILADFDDRIDELENQTFLHASDKQLQEIFGMKRLLVGMRKAVTPQRDLFASLMGGGAELPGMTTETSATSVTSTTT